MLPDGSAQCFPVNFSHNVPFSVEPGRPWIEDITQVRISSRLQEKERLRNVEDALRSNAELANFVAVGAPVSKAHAHEAMPVTCGKLSVV